MIRLSFLTQNLKNCQSVYHFCLSMLTQVGLRAKSPNAQLFLKVIQLKSWRESFVNVTTQMKKQRSDLSNYCSSKSLQFSLRSRRKMTEKTRITKRIQDLPLMHQMATKKITLITTTTKNKKMKTKIKIQTSMLTIMRVLIINTRNNWVAAIKASERIHSSTNNPDY